MYDLQTEHINKIIGKKNFPVTEHNFWIDCEYVNQQM